LVSEALRSRLSGVDRVVAVPADGLQVVRTVAAAVGDRYDVMDGKVPC
jgi:hypothetical protein